MQQLSNYKCFRSFPQSSIFFLSPNIFLFKLIFLFLVNDEKLENQENIFIYQSSRIPPFFSVAVEGNVWEVERGNLFDALVLFLYAIRIKKHSSLFGVSLLQTQQGKGLFEVVDLNLF